VVHGAGSGHVGAVASSGRVERSVVLKAAYSVYQFVDLALKERNSVFVDHDSEQSRKRYTRQSNGTFSSVFAERIEVEDVVRNSILVHTVYLFRSSPRVFVPPRGRSG
jgi:hypothetical protein